MAALLHDSTLTHTPTEAERFLAQRDLHPFTPSRAYTMLHSLAEAEQADRASTTVLFKLKFVLNEEPVSPYDKQHRKSQIARMAREL